MNLLCCVQVRVGPEVVRGEKEAVAGVVEALWAMASRLLR